MLRFFKNYVTICCSANKLPKSKQIKKKHESCAPRILELATKQSIKNLRKNNNKNKEKKSLLLS